MSSNTRPFAALALASLGCAPIAAPARPLGQPAPEGILDASGPEPAAALLLDAPPTGPAALSPDSSPSDEPPPRSESIDLTRADDFSEGFVRQLPMRCGSAAFPEAVRAADHRLKGSPADVHTAEGSARTYEVHRHCPNYPPSFDAVAVIHHGRKEMPQPPGASWWAFAGDARRAAAVPSIHWVTALPRCFAPAHPLDEAVVLKLHDWRQVDQAIRNVGSWLAARDWNGEVIIWPEPIPEPTCLK